MSIGAIIDPFIPASMPVPVVPLLTYTIFQDVSPTTKIQREDVPWSELTSKIKNAPTYAQKRACPLISIAEYADEIPEGYKSIRCAQNVRRIFGVEVDYDGEKLSIGEAADKIVAANLCSILYTSPSHTPAKPRWRALFPLSEPALPLQRAEYVGRANRILGGIASRESFVLSQSFYIGRVKGVAYEVQETQGRCIDLAVDIEPQYFNGVSQELQHDTTTDAQLRESFERGEHRYQSMLKLSSRWAARGLEVNDIESSLLTLLGTGSVNGDGIDLRSRVRPMAESAVRKYGESRHAVGSSSAIAGTQGLVHTNSSVESVPEPLRRPLPPAEQYPVEALGPVLGAAAKRICEVLNVPPAMAGQSVLAAASLAVQPLADLEIDGRREPLSLWHLTIGVSGERKSACDQLALRAHRDHERFVLEKYQFEKAEFDVQSMAHEAAVRAASKSKDPAAIRSQVADLGIAPEPPLKPLLIVSSPTIEGVAKQLAVGMPNLGLIHDDAGEFLGGHSMSAENRTKTAAALSKLWDYGEFDRVRAGDGAEKHYGKRLALHLMLQPILAETVLGDEILTGQGFLARTLMAWPASTIGARPYVETNLATDPTMLRYWDRIRAVLATPPMLREGKRNELEPRALALLPDAKRAWITVYNAIECDMGANGDWSMVSAWASKAPAQILRVAGVLALIEQPSAGVVTVDQIERAAQLVAHHLGEAVRIVGTNAVPKSTRDAEALLAWCHQTRCNHLHSAHALQSGPSSIRSKDHFDRAVLELERCGWAIPVEGGAAIDGKHRRRVWTIRGMS